ncbi:MAG: hypothetical protein HOG89_00770 [Candidatus Peribacter sp.]|jgi:hypothetical protein|nr:hypothetical protein [Candidatus Peribacter sp.]MBT4392944.1 hypothetical protein [Candidatus Peribacter sp.]MBT4601004.1 hypothetical protein [Candidatus Peribacter sp.]MBT5149046.1 hypothetical protein [Candidatus Peribacter sp.]MBT5637370.1 hypothetical protein [Candidatus Peribacter sp.]
MIRILLAVVAAANFYAAYLFFMTPEIIGIWYTLPPIDNTHRFLTMIIGALLSVFGLGALLAFFRPVKYWSIIIMLLLMHFMIFLIDVIVLARGQMMWQSIVPELIYFLVMSTALVRWFPVKKKKKEPEVPVEVAAEVVEELPDEL